MTEKVLVYFVVEVEEQGVGGPEEGEVGGEDELEGYELVVCLLACWVSRQLMILTWEGNRMGVKIAYLSS
jgi:hypothetical protein